MNLFHPIKDLYHTQYRLISILLETGELNKDKLRILDFYYCFPNFLPDIKPWPSDIKEHKIKKGSVSTPFEKVVNKKRVFFQMEYVFDCALRNLIAKELVDVSSGKKLSLVIENIPEDLLYEMKEDLFHQSSAFSTIVSGLARTVWYGPNGLKKRSGLLEFKYDE